MLTKLVLLGNDQILSKVWGLKDGTRCLSDSSCGGTNIKGLSQVWWLARHLL